MHSARVLSNILLSVGAGCVVVPLLWVGYTTWHVGPIQTAALAAWEQQAPSVNREGFVLAIPRLGLKRYVPEGATSMQLRRYGVGHITWTALPDRTGIVGIAGHRTTYGAPFFRLESLTQGDVIHVDYDGKRFAYTVTDKRVLNPNQAEVLRGSPGQRIVALVTCTPPYSAAYRLVVLGNLQNVSPLSSTQ